MPPLTRSQAHPAKRAKVCLNPKHSSKVHGSKRNSRSEKGSTSLVATLVALACEKQYFETCKCANWDPELLFTIYNMWEAGAITTEDVRLFSKRIPEKLEVSRSSFRFIFPSAFTDTTTGWTLLDKQPDPSWKKQDLKNLLISLDVGYLTGMGKMHLWELLQPYLRKLECFPPTAIATIDHYSTYMERKNAVEKHIGCSIPQLISFGMYTYTEVERDSHSTEEFSQFKDSPRCVEAWYLLISLVRDPLRDITFTACHTTFGLTLHHLKHITTYRQQPTMDSYRGSKSSETGTVVYPSNKYIYQTNKPVMRLYKLGDVFRLLIQKHGSWALLMKHLSSIDKKLSASTVDQMPVP